MANLLLAQLGPWSSRPGPLYRRLADRNNFRVGTYASDICLVNWPQNDYWLGNLIDVEAKERERHWERGKLEVGRRLPPERTLARQLAVSRTTVVQAYDVLRGDEWLESRQGSGTWVSRAPAATAALGEWRPANATVMMKRDTLVAGLTPRPGTIDLTCACLPPLAGGRARMSLGAPAADIPDRPA